jgi:hypothetical protein
MKGRLLARFRGAASYEQETAMIDVTTLPAWAKDTLRSVQTARDLGPFPTLDSPAVKLALTAEAALQNRAAQQARSEFDIARAFRRAG